MRWPLFVVVLTAASCSAPGSSSVEPATAGTVSTGTVSTGTVVGSTSPSADVPAVTVATSIPDVIPSVEVDLRLGDVSTKLVGESADAVDPFGDFVSCSGLRSAFSTYSVLVSTTVGPVRAISAITTATVAAEGIYDAAVRVERDDGSAIDATGTITLLPGLRTGSFVAFDSSGTSVEGSFECLGGPAPSPIDVGTESVGAVEVFALLRQGDSERIVGLTAMTDSLDEFRCADEIVARGDESIGAITDFRLSNNSLELMVGQVRSVFDEITLGDANDDTAGSFSAAGPEMSIDGAYRCS